MKSLNHMCNWKVDHNILIYQEVHYKGMDLFLLSLINDLAQSLYMALRSMMLQCIINPKFMDIPTRGTC